jgi:hypothetical protein
VDFSEILNLLLAGALAGAAALYKSARDERAQLAARLGDSKRAMYEMYVDLLRDVAAEAKTGKTSNTRQAATKLRNFAFRSILIASDPVVRAQIRFTNMERITTTNVAMPAIADVLHALRRDIGFTDTEITPRQLLGVFVSEIDSETIGPLFDTWEAAKETWDRKMGWH